MDTTRSFWIPLCLAATVACDGASAPGAGDADGGHGDASSGAGDASGSDGSTDPTARPSAANTGVPAGTRLTVHRGDLTVTEDGAVIEDLDIQGFVSVRASGVTIRRSIIRGGADPGTNRPALDTTDGSGTLIEDVEIAVAHPSPWIDGAHLDATVARRLDVHGGVDGLKLGRDVTFERSYVHDLSAFDSDPNQGGGSTHNDCVQILGGSDIAVRANDLAATSDDNAAIQLTQDFGPVSGIVVEGNWADGGGCTFNLAHQGGGAITVAVSDNRFGRAAIYDCPILVSTQTTLAGTGNVWDDDGTEVPVQRHD